MRSLSSLIRSSPSMSKSNVLPNIDITTCGLRKFHTCVCVCVRARVREREGEREREREGEREREH
jgi:hypothetical protein